MRLLRAASLLMVLLLGLMPVGADAGVIVFSDGTFNSADWVVDAFENANGGSAAVSQELLGGNPGAFYHIVNTVSPGAVGSTIYGLYLKPTASYSPSTQGAIINGTLSIDTQMFSGFGLGEATRTLLQQDGELFVRIGNRIDANNVGSWVTKGQSFVANEFQLISETTPGVLVIDPTQHPDFSKTGSTIVFGFSSANSTTGTTGYTIDGGYDNWQITLNTSTVPEPASIVLLAIGGVAAAGCGWRRRRHR